ncbi:Cysteine desulfurase [uncultured Clostridium sp.]|uniref:Aminotransferase class V-fold PLP-dependent enzyme n=1 Tax=Muricoprocola aceti TaxID=2981772 RepID=A0ABT2SNM0_9FIRM|nr:aminotransferase class V-fold PLP-dependent enzyme [Muricoprocola aceti]MCU6726098.1 aminotransferase class V-fold PLP-dependent enzyme [Muricoprocola aceti]SCH77579.1 Cysteine desulfurase [uncultured Clostridium sp.]
MYRLEENGVELSILPADSKGVPMYGELEQLIQKNTRAIVITHALNLSGNITDLGRVSAIAQKYKLLLVVDASQSAGCIPIDVEKMGIDVLCFTGHKGLMGPQGTGGIYVREGLKIRPLKVGGSGVHSYDREHPKEMPTALEAGTLNGTGIAGLFSSLDFILDTGVEVIHKKEMKLAKRFFDGIKDLPEVTVYGDWQKSERTAIVSVNLGIEESGQVSDWLWEDYGIAVRAGAHCAPLMHKALGTEKQGAVRFSFSYFNTEEEMDAAIQALKEILEL